MTTYLTLEDLLQLVADLGVGPIRDLGLLDSAAHRPTTSLYGHEAYPGLDDKAAAFLESLVRNHPLVDGNERLGWLAVVVFYGLNGVDLDAPDDEAYRLVVGLAAGDVEAAEAAPLFRVWRSAGEAGRALPDQG